MSKFLVTGGAGFIGSHLVERLLADGHKVTVLDDFSTGRREHLEALEHKLLTVIEADVRDAEAVAKAARSVEYIIHLAAIPSVARSVEDPSLTHTVNVDGTLNVLNAAKKWKKGVKRVVLASSSAVYGDTPTLPKTESMRPQPMSPYAVSKLTGEYYAHAYFENYAIETVALRFFNVFGPRQDPESDYAAVIPKFTTRLLRKLKPVIFGDGKQTRDFTYVSNVVDAMLAACSAQKVEGDVFNVACGERVTIGGLSNMIGGVVGWSTEPRLKPARSGDVRHSLADVGKAEDVLGYRVKVNLQEGLERTVEWYRKCAEASSEKSEAAEA
jgi:UDP-N-acetylglucosamine/UDP-N-acetyl-alpha-D-glucosaminouronate 4-epimerase